MVPIKTVVPSLAEAKAGAEYIALSQSWEREPTNCDSECVRLGALEVTVQHCQFVNWEEDKCLPSTPEVIEVVDPESSSEGTLRELRLRLIMIDTLTALSEGDESPDTIRAAFAFTEDFGVRAPIPERIASADFAAWIDCGRDLTTWFLRRFAVSRLYAI
jgi:hypothetical protein